MPDVPLSDQHRPRSVLPVALTIETQQEGYASYTADPDGRCPYPDDTPYNRALRQAWVRGRAWARVEAMDAAGLFDTPEDDTPEDDT